MHLLWTLLLCAIALVWIIQAIEVARGVPSMRSLAEVLPAHDENCPTLSILVAARNEAEKLPAAIQTFLSLDYPRYEIIAVDDRSIDATGAILARAAAADPRLKPLRVDSLPPGWLGKPHALQRAYEKSTGEYLVFTDADVHFEPDLLRRSVALAQRENWDHLTLLGRAKLFTAGEKIAMSFFAMAFLLSQRPWSVSDPKSPSYLGVGAFQQVRRIAYEQMGTHRRLAMEVVDDIKLGKLAKDAGVTSGVAKAGNGVSVHWHSGLRNMVLGTTKNFFATTGFRLSIASFQILSLLLMFILPLFALPLVHGWSRLFAAVAVAVPLIAEIGVCVEFAISPLYAATFPAGAVILAVMLARSTIVTLQRGGIEWRGTFYPLEELKRGLV